MASPITTTELSKSLVYLVAPNGGDNYWARIINGCDKVYLQEEGTLSVSLSRNGRYLLTCHSPFFDNVSMPMRKLGLIHEAGHLALRHIERYMRVVAQQHDKVVRSAADAVYNWAMDFAVNDAIVRLEPEFKRTHKPRNSNTGEWTFLLPEEWGFPRGKSMEWYLRALTKDLERMHQEVTDQLGKMFGARGEPSTSSEESGKRPSGGGENDDESLPPGFVGKAKDVPEMFEALQKFFDQNNHSNHNTWRQVMEEVTSEEALSMANKMKRHARRLVKSAHEQTVRERGTIPGNIESLVKSLLEPDPEPWDWAFQDIVASSISSKIIEEMVVPNQGLLELDYVEPWPGSLMDFSYNVTWMTDSSGSMGDIEYARAVQRFNALLATNKSLRVTYVECDAAIQKELRVENISVPDADELEKIKTRKGRGGTVYTPFFKRVLNLDGPEDWVQGADRPLEPHPKPDLIIVATDGGVVINGECFPQYRPDCPIIWLVMPDCNPARGMENVAPDRVVKMFYIKPEFDD